MRRLLPALGIALVLVSCSSEKPTPSEPSELPATTLAQTSPDVSALPPPDVVSDGLSGPTQFLEHDDGSLIVAQLNGDEDSATGQIVRIEPTTGTIRVLIDGLDKPTGVAVLDGGLWVMERRALVRFTWDGGNTPVGPRETVLTGLPFNGRSSGTLTSLDATTLLYETSGELAGSTDTGTVTPGSGTLFALDTRTRTSRPIATGSKHAYAHWVTSGNRVLTTEILDGPGVHPPDELNVVNPEFPTDFGWPKCPADQPEKPGCSEIPPPLAVFPPDSTPTAVVADGNDVYVSLFVPGTIVRLSMAGWKPGQPPRPFRVVAENLEGPHSMVVSKDGRLLVSEHFRGRILGYRRG